MKYISLFSGIEAASVAWEPLGWEPVAFEVRKLTPIEYERLQGFPDDWTKVPYRGKEADQCPDAPRYKAIGNYMAVPVMRWIGERIEMVDQNWFENRL